MAERPRLVTRATDACCVRRDAHICCGNPQSVSQGLGVQKNVVDDLLERNQGDDAKGEHGSRHAAPRDNRFLNRFVSPNREQQRLPSLRGSICWVSKETQVADTPRKGRNKNHRAHKTPNQLLTHLYNETGHTSSWQSVR